MSLALKKQFSEFEIDEFTPEVSTTVEEAITEIRNFDWINESAKSDKIVEEHAEPSIWLRNHSGDTFSLCWAEGKFVIYVMIRKAIRRSTTTIVNDQEEVSNLVKLFAACERELLLSRLRTSDHYPTLWLLDLFSYFTTSKTRDSRDVTKEEYVYRITFWKIFKKLIFSLALLLFPAVIWFNPFQSRSRPIDWVAFFVVQGFLTLLAAPTFIILINHLKKNAGWQIYFRKGDNTFFIIHNGGKQMFDKHDFEKRIVTSNKSNAPWSEFEYNTLITKEGKQLHISSLLIPSAEMDKLFGRMEFVPENSKFQIIRNKVIKQEK